MKILWVGDAGCQSGFALATHHVIEYLDKRCLGEHEVTVLGVNYRGDPHSYPYPLYAASAGGDGFGLGRLIWMCDTVKPDLIVFQNDGWNIPAYIQQLQLFPEYAGIPVIAVVAVDGKNFDGKWLDGVTLAVFWTEFALNEARLGGYEGPAVVIPLGVDTRVYYPMPSSEARQRRLGNPMKDKFIVGNVNRNQPRKRWDLTLRYFAEWLKQSRVDNAYLFLHTAPTGDTATNVKWLAKYYGVLSRLALMEPPTWYGLSENAMRDTYNCFDVQVSTTQGEGFGLTTFEGMACGVTQIVPNWSALGELCRDVAYLVPCSSTAIGPPYVNVIGGVADEAAFIQALHHAYTDTEFRNARAVAGLQHVKKFNWEHIGKLWTQAVQSVVLSQEKVA